MWRHGRKDGPTRKLIFKQFLFFLMAAVLLFQAFQVNADTKAGSFGNKDSSENAGHIELHAHLFMKEGMGWTFRGHFDEPLEAKSWRDGFSSQANPETLNKSNLDITVVSLYAHPLFIRSLRGSIREQIALTKKFVTEHPQWAIATDPKMARKNLNEGKHVLILSLEGASGILENDEDLEEFIDRGGIRIVNLLHLTDDQFGGVAFLGGFKNLASPIALFRSFFVRTFGDESGKRIRLNSHGLTEEGKVMAQKLIQRKVWLDLAHASDASQADLNSLLNAAGQRPLYTHTTLRKYYGAERGISSKQLEEVAKYRGIVGLMPSELMLEGTPSLVSNCRGSIEAFATQYKEVAAVIGQNATVMGSDINGGIPHLKPACLEGTSLKKEGLWNIGQTPYLWKALYLLGVATDSDAMRRAQVDRFLDAWAGGR